MQKVSYKGWCTLTNKLLVSLFCSLFLLSGFQLYAKEISKEAKIFKKCAKCHGERGRHKAFDRSEIIAGQDVSDLVESMKFYKDSKFEARGVTKVMAKYIKQLSYDEIIALAKYISKL